MLIEVGARAPGDDSTVDGPVVIGWDVGGANVKAAAVTGPESPRILTVSRPFEIWRGPERLQAVLGEMAAALPPARATGVTMTAELSDAFRTKREGVGFVLHAVTRVAPGPVWVYATDGSFVGVARARAEPLLVAASNWVATATLLAARLADAVLLDVGSTTTDVVPIRGGRVAARGRTDPERLLARELVYTGAVRTNVAAVLRAAPVRGGLCPVASELFAVSGDAHVLLGDLAPEEYEAATPDGRPPTPEFAAERLARVVCADGEMLDARDIAGIARAVAEGQVADIAAAVREVAGRFPQPPEAVVTGQGAFLARRAAGRAGLACRDLDAVVGFQSGHEAPAAAVAWLLVEALAAGGLPAAGPA
jgi:probable H4MPT-linked C1 transfer pathway protein